MKHIISLIIFTISLCTTNAAFAAKTIGLSVSYHVVAGSLPQVGELDISSQSVFNFAKKKLEAKGWNVVDVTGKSHTGIEAKININAIQNANNAYAISAGLFGVNKGNTRNAFNYSSALVSYSGPNAIENMQNSLGMQLDNWINSTF